MPGRAPRPTPGIRRLPIARHEESASTSILSSSILNLLQAATPDKGPSFLREMPTAHTSPRLRARRIYSTIYGGSRQPSQTSNSPISGPRNGPSGRAGSFFDKVRRERQRQLVTGDCANPLAAPITSHLTSFGDRNYR